MRIHFMALALAALTACTTAQDYEMTATGVKATTGDGCDVEIQWFTPNTLRVLKTPKGKATDKTSLSVIAEPRNCATDVTFSNGEIVMKSEALTVTLNKETGVIAFAKADGTSLLKELANDKPFTSFNDAGRATYTVYQGFDTDNDEGLYGLGQLQSGKLMQRDMVKELFQDNTEDVTPMFQSTKGYGVFWDNYSTTTYTDNDDETSFKSVTGSCIDYYFMYGGNADGVIAEVRHLTGEVPMMPLWSYGFMQSRERYKSQEETEGVVRKYRELGVPIDCIIQDWQYWGNNYLWNAMEFLGGGFSNAKRMIDDIHAMNAKIMISIWQSFGPKTKPYRELDEAGLLFDIETWPQSGVDQWPPRLDYPSGVRVYDPYSAKARDIYWKYLNEGLFSMGIDAWWMDSTDPDHFNRKEEDFDHVTELGTFRSLRNAFPLMCVGGVSEHQRATTSDKRVFILTRSGFLGQQRYGSNVWTGDVQSSWESFRNQIPAGLNFSMLGMPHWNTDLGGFFCGSYNNMWEGVDATTNPLFHELYVRWLQFGIFCPIMRSHGADAPREFYLYGKKGEPVYDALVDAVKLRYALLPYIYSTAWDVTHNQSTFMRALVMDFTDDRQTWDINDEYMFGKAFLVAPVVNAQYTPETVQKKLKENEGWNKSTELTGGVMPHPNFREAKSMEVYLPQGANWYNYWTGKLLEGGATYNVATSFSKIPLFVRAGSIVAIGPDVQYTSERPWDNLSLNVYPGADAEFTLYEDEGDNYNYENGAYTEIPMRWDDQSRTLTIGARKGSYDGMLKERKFNITTPDGKRQTVNYSGSQVTVKM